VSSPGSGPRRTNKVLGTFEQFAKLERLKAVLGGLGAKSQFRFVPDRTHFDLYKIGEDRHGLLKQISWAMYAVARPPSGLTPAVPTAP
jgi:hypothetical protein